MRRMGVERNAKGEGPEEMRCECVCASCSNASDASSLLLLRAVESEPLSWSLLHS